MCGVFTGVTRSETDLVEGIEVGLGHRADHWMLDRATLAPTRSQVAFRVALYRVRARERFAALCPRDSGASGEIRTIWGEVQPRGISDGASGAIPSSSSRPVATYKG